METSKENVVDYYAIDIAHILKTVWHRAWLVVIVSILVAAIAFSFAAFVVTPMYSSSIMLYVNNSSINVGDVDFSISSSDLTAAQSLVKTYTVLLKNRTTLEQVIDKTDVDYTWEDLNDMVESSPVDETEIMKVTVTCDDPYMAEKLANGIAEVLPQRISEIVEGSSMEVVDSAIVNHQKVSPSITKYTALGFVLGAFIAIAALVVAALMDNTIHDDEYVLNTYGYPILAKVPNLLDMGTKKYGYYNQGKKTAGGSR